MKVRTSADSKNKSGKAVIIIALLIFSLLSLSACYKKIPIPEGLVNRGKLPLSTTDPFLGPNIFLSREMERSSYLHNFIKKEGAPLAIELDESSWGEYKMIMYFPDRNQAFVAHPEQDEMRRQWIIRGPYQVNRRDYKDVQIILHNVKGDPVFYLFGREHHFPTAAGKTVSQPLTPVVLPTPKPTPKPKPKKKAPPKKPLDPLEQKASVTDPKLFVPLNTDQQAISMSKGYAERNEIGDIVHTVSGSGQTLNKIADWYTANKANAKHMRGTTGMALDAPLADGTRIVVPIEMIKRTKVMPAH